ncbi:MAG: glycosyltransferase [Gemmatimonadetes bacterium]|nr:glycosyltransferase [Gemmatimonadota bacterium]
MARRIEIDPLTSLGRHAQHVNLAPLVRALREEAAAVSHGLRDRTVWMINSAAQGGGVAEMMPGVVTHLRELGIRAEWVVLESDDEQFFELTKRIHNLIHGEGEPHLSEEDRRLFERVNRENADVLQQSIRAGDVVVVHDPQPMPMADMLRENIDITTVWRCHIGLDQETPATTAAWRFLEPYATGYHHAVFSAPEYVPSWFEGRSSIIYPALDPLTAKNHPMRVQTVVSVLERSGLLRMPGPTTGSPFDAPARRFCDDGTWQPAAAADDIGLLTRPIVTQVSRWDRLKGFLPLMRGFARYREGLGGDSAASDDQGRRLGHTRLVLAGPDPDSISDDPEGRDVLDELCAAYLTCDSEVRPDIVLVAVPMQDAHVNALIVNALQRVSTIVVQNSLREGFGLTITEAMWKGVPVLSNSRACGPRQQVRDGVDGRMIGDPEDLDEIANTLRSMLSSDELDAWGQNAQHRVHEHFLIYSQLGHWVRLLDSLTGAAKAA